VNEHQRDTLERIIALVSDEPDLVARMATAACELHTAFDSYHWTGFYRMVGDELVIGPYQGGHGCLRIALDRGVCGAAASQRKTLVVDDVHAFEDHIACSATTNSEIVVPLVRDGELLGVLDVDSDDFAVFGEHQAFLEAVARHVA